MYVEPCTHQAEPPEQDSQEFPSPFSCQRTVQTARLRALLSGVTAQAVTPHALWHCHYCFYLRMHCRQVMRQTDFWASLRMSGIAPVSATCNAPYSVDDQGWAVESGHQEESTVGLVNEGGKARARWPGSEALWPQCCRRAPSSEKRSRGAASKGAARRGEDAADVLMLRGVLGALSLSLQATSNTSMSPRLHSCMGDSPATFGLSHSGEGGP